MKTINNYASLVKEKHALNKTIAPVETDLTDASQAYAIGQNFIYDGILYKAKTAIAQHDALVLNTNYEAADDIATQIAAKQDPITVDNVPTENSDNLVKSGGVYSAEANIYAAMKENGAYNLLDSDFRGTSGSYGTLTVTDNEDGTITVTGTSNTSISYEFKSRTLDTFGLEAGVYKFICEVDGTYTGTLTKEIYTAIGGVGTKIYDESVGVDSDIIIDSSYGYLTLQIRFGADLDCTNGITIKPIIRTKTNQELATQNQTLSQKIGTTTTKTLAANATSIEFDVPTSGINLIKFSSSDGSFYTAIDTSVSGKVTLTFEASASARTIACQIAQA